MFRDKDSLTDLIHFARRVLAYVDGIDQVTLEQDDEKQAAVLYRIVVMGEASKRLSSEFRQAHPEIPWKEIIGMRDRIIHQYDRVNYTILWETIQQDIPELLALLEPLLDKNAGDEG